MQAAVGGVEAETDHVAPKRSVSELSFYEGEVAAVKLPTYFSFKENGEAFIKPEALPVSAGDCVAGP